MKKTTDSQYQHQASRKRFPQTLFRAITAEDRENRESAQPNGLSAESGARRVDSRSGFHAALFRPWADTLRHPKRGLADNRL